MGQAERKKVTASAVIQQDTADALSDWARQTGRTRSQIVETAIRFYLEMCHEAKGRLEQRTDTPVVDVRTAAFAAELRGIQEFQTKMATRMLSVPQEIGT